MPIHGYPGNVITANPTAPTVSSASGVWTTEQQLINQSAGRWPMAQTQISRSLRFNSADSAYLNRTPASAGSTTLGTLSNWIKLGVISTDRMTYHVAGTSGNNNRFYITFNADNTFQIVGYNSSASIVLNLNTTQLFRDPSAWYHIVVAIDTTQATSSNRAKLYINGTQVTAFSTATYPSQNQALGFTNNTSTLIGSNQGVGNLFNGYITEVNFIDGLALDPSYFGFNNSDTGVWTPRQYTGTYGTNGFYLNFSDNSNTTAATLGKDYSGNGNNWTPNNFSVTAGSGNDSLVDSPTSYGTDTGVGGEVRGNYATLNPVDSATSASNPSNGNLDWSSAAANANYYPSRGTIGVSSGKWYWEVTPTSSGGGFQIGIAGQAVNFANNPTQQLYNCVDGYVYFSSAFKGNNGSTASYGATYTTNDVIGIALDMDAGTLVFYKNGVSQGTAYSSLSGTFFAAISDNSASDNSAATFNFGQRPFTYTAPSGFKALCTQNLPTPTIGATSTTQANDYMNVVTWTGVNSTAGRSVTGVGFSPDFVWAKRRSASADHLLYDTIRGAGVTKELSSNVTLAEGANNTDIYDYLSSFDADGFSSTWSGSNTAYYFNELNATYVAWNWNAGGSTVTNTSGTISAQVRANTTSGFSIVTYTAPSSGAFTVGHGLGVAPAFIITKSRSNAYSWGTYHQSIGNTGRVDLNSASGTTTTQNSGWNNTSPTSTVFSMGSDWAGSGITYVAYCFAPVAGYSAFGSYTGNGSADGPFVFTNFRPRFILIKRTDSTANWRILDTARDTYNVEQYELYPNLTNAEGTFSALDGLSNGFKIRTSDTAYNASGGTYIYAAFAESPFKYSLAR